MHEGGWLVKIVEAEPIRLRARFQSASTQVARVWFSWLGNWPWMVPDNIALFGGFGGPIETGRPAHQRV